MKNQALSIFRMVENLNNEACDGGFWLPNIQRKFVWEPDQIERLFDSVMRKYPIGTLLVWTTNSDTINYRKFIERYVEGEGQKAYSVPTNDKRKHLVLDGQQRLQSFLIGLKGSYNGKELCFDVTSGEVVVPDDIRFVFKFKKLEQIAFPFVTVKSILGSAKDLDDLCDDLIDEVDHLSKDDKKRVRKNIMRLVQSFKIDECLIYQDLDGTTDPNHNPYDDDAIVEIFIRANSGGTKLGKSDLLFSLLTSDWSEAENQIEELREELNKDGYNFTRDYILKTSLVLLGKKAQYQVTKFRDPEVRSGIKNNWDKISAAILDVRDYLYNHTYLRTDKAIPSYACLMPIIFFRYTYPKKWKSAVGVDEFIVRCMLCGTFSWASDTGVDNAVDVIKACGDFDAGLLYKRLKDGRRTTTITQQALLSTKYGDQKIHLLFNIWYSSFNFKPASSNNLPQVDHIFARSILDLIREVNPETGKKTVKRYVREKQDQIANCMLLTQKENGPAGKGDKTPDVWFADKDDDYLEMHLIPKDRELWKVDRFDDFVAARKKLLVEKFAKYLGSEEED